MKSTKVSDTLVSEKAHKLLVAESHILFFLLTKKLKNSLRVNLEKHKVLSSFIFFSTSTYSFVGHDIILSTPLTVSRCEVSVSISKSTSESSSKFIPCSSYQLCPTDRVFSVRLLWSKYNRPRDAWT